MIYFFNKSFSIILLIVFLFSCGRNSTKVPLRFAEISFSTSGNWIFIKLRINNSDSLNFIIDSGVDETIINKRTAELLNCKFDKKANFSGALGSDSVCFSENNTIEVGNLKIDSIILGQVPLENLEQTFGVTIDGFIGEALFKRYVVNIDFEKERIQLFLDEKNFIQKDSLFSIDLKIISKVPVIKTEFIINNFDTMFGRFMVDLGYRNSIAFNTPFVNKNNLIAKIDNYYSFNATGILAEGKSYMARLKSFILGNQNLNNITYMVSLSSSGTLSTDEYDGIIGMDVLTRFSSVCFDYRNNKMYLGKYIYIADSIYSDVNCSGLELKKLANSSIIINAVYNNSPAIEVGLKKGDELIYIKGTSVNSLELTEVKKILREKGKTIDIQVKRGYKNLNFKLNLRELI